MEQQNNPLKYPFIGCDDPHKNYSDLMKNMMAAHYLTLSQQTLRDNVVLKMNSLEQIEKRYNVIVKIHRSRAINEELYRLSVEKRELEMDIKIDKEEIGYLYNCIDDYNQEYRKIFTLTMGRSFVTDLSKARMNYRKIKRDEFENVNYNGGSNPKKSKLC